MKKNKKILVTGAAGFIGSHLVDYLINKKYLVYGIDDLSGGYLRNVNKKCIFTKLDLRKKEKIKKYIEKIKPELIYHLAADATEGRSQFTPLECTERNYLAYLNLLIPAIKNGLKKIVLVSSMSVYGAQKPPFVEAQEPSPEDIYGISKTSMEKATKILARVHNFKYVIIRPHNVYGPKQNMADPYRNVVAIFINRLLLGKHFFIYGDGKQKRAYTYIDDCVIPLAKSAFIKKAENQIFNVGSDKEYSINELAKEVLINFFGTKKYSRKFIPVHLPDRPQEVKNAFSLNQKSRKIIKYNKTTSLSDGIKKMVIWSKKIGYQKPVYLPNIELPSKKLPQTWSKKMI